MRGLGWQLRESLVNRILGAAAPTSSDYEYPIGSLWLYGGAAYVLLSVTGVTADWLNLGLAGDVYVNFEYWAEISSGTTGTITPPTGASFVLDQWPGDIDAVVSTVTTGKVPDGELAFTSAGVVVTTTLTSGGAYSLSAAPASYPVAIIYAARVKLSDFDDTKVLGQPRLDEEYSFTSIAVADLTDSATPSVLTIEETTGKLISNYKSTGADHVFTMPAPHAKGNVIFTIGDEFQVDIEPNSGDLFYLNGIAMAADEHIVNSADTLEDEITGVCKNINGTLRWSFKSDSANWVEATP